MPPSRRQLLRSSALSLSMFGGCSMTDRSNPANLTETTQSPNTSKTEETTVPTEKPPSLPCGPGPLPDSGWPLPDASPGRANYAPDASGPTTKPSVEWSVPIPSPEYPVTVFTQPTVADGRVYVGRAVSPGKETDGPDTQYVYAYDAETGEQVWRAAIPQRPGTLIATGNMVLVPSEPYRNSTLHAFDAATGENKWARSLPTPINTVLPTSDGILVTSFYDNTGTRMYDTDGHLNWHIEKYASDITWANGIAYGVSDGHLVAIETANGTVAWMHQLQYDNDTSGLLLATSCAVFVATEGVLQAVRRDGTQAWSIDAEIREMATDGERIFAVDGSDRLRCFGIADGKQRWKRFIGEEKGETHAFYGKLVVDGQTVYAGTSSGRLLALSKDDGSERWRLGKDTVNGRKICLVGDTLYGVSEFGEYDDSLLAFR